MTSANSTVTCLRSASSLPDLGDHLGLGYGVCRSVLVTGASTGIGRATALRLDAAGWRVFAGVRREADADLLREAGTERLAPLILDVTDAGQIEAAAEQIAARTGGDGLDGLVNNAGIARARAAGDDADRRHPPSGRGQPDRPGRRHPGDASLDPPARGRIVFISSIGGRIAFPMNGAYHAGQVRDRGGRRRLPPGAAALGHIGLDRRAGLDRDPDLGARRAARSTRSSSARRRREELYGKPIAAVRRASRKIGERRHRPRAGRRRAIEHALTARRPRTRYLVGLDAKSQARAKILIPARVLDRIVARMIGS